MSQEYSVNGSNPTINAPEIYNENNELIDIDSVSDEILFTEFNIKRIQSVSYDIKKQKKVWNEETLEYDVVDLSSEELESIRKPIWDKIKIEVDDRLNKINKKIEEQLKNDGRVMTFLTLAKNSLEEVKLYDGDPELFNFTEWQTLNPESLQNNLINPELDYMSLEELENYKKTDEYLQNWGPES